MIANAMRRRSLLVESDQLIILDHGATKDRLRRIPFHRVETVMHWRVAPWGRMFVFFLLLGLPAVLFAMAGGVVPTAFAIFFLVILVTVLAYYLYYRKTTLRIDHGADHYVVTGVTSPRKFRRFIAILKLRIRAAQADAEEERDDLV